MKKIVVPTMQDKKRKRAAEVYKEYKEKQAKAEITPKDGRQMAQESIAKWRKYMEDHPTPKIEYQWKKLQVGDHIMWY